MLPDRKANRDRGRGARLWPALRHFRARVLLPAALLCMAIVGCASQDAVVLPDGAFAATDCEGRTLRFAAPPTRVVVLQASLADLWLTAGGRVIGVTEDAQERGLDVGGAALVGSTKHPSLESILALSPEMVVYSPDIAGQAETAAALEGLNIQTFGAKVDAFRDYLFCLKAFTSLTGETARYDKYGTAVEAGIQDVIDAVPAEEKPRVLFLRAYSSGVKAKAREHVVCDMLDDLGAVNIAAQHESLLEELSLETIIQQDPDAVLIVYMGEKDEAAMALLSETLLSQPAWQTLTAVKNGCVHELPTELFHYKPNARWAEAYQYLYDILYGASQQAREIPVS